MYDSEIEAIARGEFDLSDPTERELARLVDPVSEPEVSAAAIRDAILALAPDAPIICEQTGGGTATIYVGEADAAHRYAVAIGPGSYDWTDSWSSTFDLGDTAVGPDDDGEAEATYPETVEAIAEAAVETLRR